ncbi:hypothetical protein TRVA0_031S00738 [Trichomonascus vanleenenianus]|uniref:translation initiation factor eIF-2B subunit n=1 Tax=Trichomonascus vanleenenianus TaxID=2268995 RepID=UPI003ECA76CC
MAEDEAQGISAKELKAQKKAEKAAKRAANKVAQGLPPTSSKQQGPPGTAHQGAKGPSGGSDKRLTLFDHLEQASHPALSSATDVHPAIVKLTLHMAYYKIVGSTERCRAMLEAFQEVIRDYSTPANQTVSRHLQSVLSHQIDYLKTGRPLSISMGNSIRWLKQEISKVSIDISEAQAKQELIEQIENFIRERIDVADQVIVASASATVEDGAVVLTYGHSLVVRKSLIRAHERGKKFKVVVVDSRPLYEGKRMAKALVEAGIPCTYVMLTALTYIIKDVTSVMLGAHGMFSNGLLYSRVGTSMIATSAKSRNIPVLVLCESIKFTDRVQLDSVTYNELANPKTTPNDGTSASKEGAIDTLNILYDLSPSGTIKKVITELGSLPASSVPVVLREYKAT